jgi:hypothetical protein
MESHQLEAFALAKDRAKALEQLIPGTEDHYFYSCLLHEQAGRDKEIDALLAAWVKRHGETALVGRIRHRLALLRYETAPEETREYLRYNLGLSFDHQRAVEGRKTQHPTALEPAVTRETIRKIGYQRSHDTDLSGFTDAALDWLMDEKIEPKRVRHLLGRLRRPDYAKLPELVAADLKDPHSSGFGSIAIHGLLLKDQLERLLKLKPDLILVDAFVNACLVKLQPGPDVDWQNDARERESYLTRLWDFVKPLAPKFNALKAHVLYHRLDHDRAQGVYDPARFLDYVKLPRQVSYANNDYLKTFRSDTGLFGLGQDYRPVTLHAAFGDDEELVRDYLSRFFLTAPSVKPYDAYMAAPFLNEVFASAKILNGTGDMEKWYSLLNNPGFYQALKDRIEISFARTNPAWFRADEPVSLAVDVKNVSTLAVKVFEINALNYFLAHGRDVDTSVDLDGLVASEEKTYAYGEPPNRRVRRTFEFPALSKPGVYVVELIGGGISSRALVRKGRLRFVERMGASGHVFAILDENRAPLKDASLWLAGREYRAEEDGEIRVPYSAAPGRQSILLRRGALTTLEAFDHRAERYALTAGLYVDRESLLKKKEAKVLLRPTLTVNGIPVSLKLLEEHVLVIASTDRDGVGSTAEVAGLELREDRETVHAFQVPDGLASISFAFRAKVQSLSENKKLELSDARSFALNGIDAGPKIEDVHLIRRSSGYALYLLGKSGEARKDVPLNVRLGHRDVTSVLDRTLQTDEAGRVELGHLRDVASLSVSSPSGVSQSWRLPNDRCARVGAIHARAGEPIRVPLMEIEPLGGVGVLDENGKPAKPTPELERRDVSLLERLGGTFVRDRFESVSRKDGYLEISGLPSGDYDLYLKREGAGLTIRVAPGEDRAGWVVGDKRLLERRNPRPLQISGVEVAADAVRVVVGHANAGTRVHVFGTRFVPGYSSFDELGRAGIPGPRSLEVFKGPSHYVSGRDIGDEYRYILERRYAAVFPGSMLARPGLLLNPWAVRGTETETQEAAAGEAYAASPAPSMSAPGSPPAAKPTGGAAPGSFSNLDFLAHPAAVLANLAPDERGVVSIPRAALAHASQIRVVAVDALNTVCRDVLLPEPSTPHQDLRLRLGLDADKHFTEKKQVSVLPEGRPLEIADITTSTVEVYDALPRVYRLFATLSNDATLAAFGFALRWPDLPAGEKTAKYSEFACHELSFFLSRKDPEFFKSVIQPYLRNKKDKTFMDRYLLGDDLSSYREPWAYGRLNIVERILLSRRFDDEGAACERHAGDLCDLLPRDVERANHLFQSAIQSSALEAGDKLGLRAAASAVEEQKMRAEPVGALHASFGARSAAGAGLKGGGMQNLAGPAAKRKQAEKADFKDREEAPMEAALDDLSLDESSGGGADRARDVDARARMRQFYQKLDKTQEWAENNYYRLTADRQGPELITINPFWRDYAKHRADAGPFLSPNAAYASGSFAEMMLALAVLDLPFAAEKPEVAFEEARMTLTSKTRCVAYHKEIKPAEPAAERVPILVSQNYLRDDDRTRRGDDGDVDKYATGEFLVNVVYACRVVLTNPTSARQKLDLLMQIPRGALPVKNGFVTKGRPTELSPYSTQSFEYAFYFPAPGTFPHYPVHVAKNESLIASAEPTSLTVVRELSDVDKTSWAWLSQNGEAKDVLRWLDENNIDRIAPAGLALVAWRMREKPFYDACLALLRKRHVYDATLWQYSVHHDDVPNIREFLQHCDSFVEQCGPCLESPLLLIDPVARGRYQHLEYAPLVNARTQKLGARRKILNGQFAEQYAGLMDVLCYRKALADADRLATAYYLLLQDRIEEGLEAAESVDPKRVDTALQYDYLKTCAELLRERPEEARKIAARHKDHPVDRWRDLFRNALAQIEEISGAAAAVVDDKDRDQRQARLAASEPDFDFSVEKNSVSIHAQNLSAVSVNYYRMDIELLFSRQPFVQQQSGQFSFIKPNRSDEVPLPSGKNPVSFDLPKEFSGANVIVELVAAGRRKSQAYYAHALAVQVIENYGQVRVTRRDSGGPLAKTYVKVYARMKGGEVKFYKDGYTDLRGRFDYTSLNTNELDFVERFSLLVLSAENGAVIREADPPKR